MAIYCIAYQKFNLFDNDISIIETKSYYCENEKLAKAFLKGMIENRVSEIKEKSNNRADGNKIIGLSYAKSPKSGSIEYMDPVINRRHTSRARKDSIYVGTRELFFMNKCGQVIEDRNLGWIIS